MKTDNFPLILHGIHFPKTKTARGRYGKSTIKNYLGQSVRLLRMRKFPSDILKKHAELRVFKKLNTPEKIQDFLDRLPINFETQGDTCRSPLETLRAEKAQCMEGAMLAGAALWYHGKPPLILDLKTLDHDDSHVVTLFKYANHWGAISKTNHAVLRYRDPVFKNIRELAMSYFNEYFTHAGEKTLQSFAGPFNLLRYGTRWITASEPLFHIVTNIDHAPHVKILSSQTKKRLRKADLIEIEAGKLVEWRALRNKPYRSIVS